MQKIFLGILFFMGSLSASATLRQNPFEDFKMDVHPILVQQCQMCHGNFQKPLHALEDPAEAYTAARPLINLQFPEQSTLWVRSYNGHCGKLDICGVQNKGLLQGIKKWIDGEKQFVVEDKDFQKINSAAFKIPQQLNEVTTFDIASPKGEVYSFSVKRFSESIVYFYSPQVDQVKEGLVFDGFTLTSADVQMKAQNFNDLAKVIKPTMTKLPLSNDGSGYILGILPQTTMAQGTITLAIKNYRTGLNLQELTQFFNKGYDPIYEQVILEVDPKVVQVATGDAHTCALDEKNGVKCWGRNNYGALGLEIAGPIGLTPNELGANLPYLRFGKTPKITQMGIGNNHGCVLFDDGRVKCWGDNYYGQLGLNTTEYMGDNANEMGDNLSFLNFGVTDKVVKIAVGYDSNCALFETGKIKCWGINGNGELGLGDTSNKAVSTAPGNSLNTIPFLDFPAKATDLFAGPSHFCAVFDKTVVKCWGGNDSGELGVENTSDVGDNETAKSFKAVDLGTTTPIKFLALGADHTCAYFENDKMKCWGSNSSGELGLGNTNSYGASAKTMGTNLPFVDLGEPLQQLSLGTDSSCALFVSGMVKCWGSNVDGKLGLGSMNNKGLQSGESVKELPVVNVGKSKAMQIATGGNHSCIISKDGLLKCWGTNTTGQLGLGNMQSVGGASGDMGDALSPVDLGQSKKVIF